MNSEYILCTMSDISLELNLLVNSSKQYEDGFLFFGKKFKSYEDYKESGLEPPHTVIDFRNNNVDESIALQGREYLVKKVIKFCQTYKDGDLQTMLIACALNLYYSLGLFDRCGILPVSEFDRFLQNNEDRKYVHLIEKNILLTIWEYVQEEIGNTSENMFVKAILNQIDTFNEVKKYEHDDFISEMREINESYQYANILYSIEKVKKYIWTEGKDVSFLDSLDKCEDDIREIAMGLKKTVAKNYAHDKEINVSNFGLGIPYIKCKMYRENCSTNNINDVGKNNYIRDGLSNAIGIPAVVLVDSNVMRYSMLLAYKYKKSEMEKQKALDEKKKIINRFSHTYKGMRATSLYNIAMELINQDKDKFKNLGRKLLYEYSVKKNLTRDVEMLELRFEDKINELNEKITSSILKQEMFDSVKVSRIISDALTRCMITLVHDAKAKDVRKGFQGFDLIEIRSNFEHDVLLNSREDVKEWFAKNVFDLKFIVSDSWERIFFEKESYAALLLTDIITELIINIFKYACKSDPILIEFTENEECLIIKTKNKISEDIVKEYGSGNGLVSEGDIIDVLNNINGKKEHAIESKEKNGHFYTNISIARNIFNV